MRVCAYIDISALQHNLQQVKKIAPNSSIMAMVKANAYGHGLLCVAEHLSTVDAFGVATIEEAISLRISGIEKPIVIMSGFTNQDELNVMVAKQFTAVVHSAEQLALLRNTSLPSPLTVWLKLDSGMHRLGFLPEEFSAAYAQLSDSPNIKKPIGFFTHLACSDEPDNPHTLEQIAVFQKNIQWPGPRSLACSAALIAWPEARADWIRPGIMLYGVSPFKNRTGSSLNLKPVMTLTSRLLAIKQLRKGDSVGYGATWVCPENTRIGIVSIGYGDGYPRQARQGTPVLVNGKRCALIGRVSMDLISVDLSEQPDARMGDKVILWGADLPVEEIASCADTIAYELLCKITARVPYKEKFLPPFPLSRG